MRSRLQAVSPEMKIDEGDRIDAGKIVATLDKSYFTDELRLARARVAGQTAVLAKLVSGTRPEEIAQARAIVAEREASVVLADRYFEPGSTAYSHI